MDVSTITEIFSNLAVPVACLVAVFWLWYQETVNHREEISKLTEALNNNTLVMQQIKDKLKVEE